jgi:hypothetical protein
MPLLQFGGKELPNQIHSGMKENTTWTPDIPPISTDYASYIAGKGGSDDETKMAKLVVYASQLHCGELA